MGLWAGLALALVAVAGAADADRVMERFGELAPLRAMRSAPDVPEIPADEYRRVAEGDVATGVVAVEGYKAKKAWGAGLVSAPIARVYAAVNDEIGAQAYTRIEHSEVVSGTRCVSGRAVLQFLPVPLISDRWWITHLSANDGLAAASGGAMYEIWWTSSVDPDAVTSDSGRAILERGMPIEYTKGGWLMAAVDDARTLLEYFVWTDPGGRIPAGPASSFAAGSIEDTIAAIERFANEGSPACPAP